MVKRLMDAGYGHRLLLSHDESVVLLIAPAERRELRKQRNPDGFAFIFRRVIPQLRELGVSETDIHRLFVDNPRRFFEGAE